MGHVPSTCLWEQTFFPSPHTQVSSCWNIPCPVYSQTTTHKTGEKPGAIKRVTSFGSFRGKCGQVEPTKEFRPISDHEAGLVRLPGWRHSALLICPFWRVRPPPFTLRILRFEHFAAGWDLVTGCDPTLLPVGRYLPQPPRTPLPIVS